MNRSAQKFLGVPLAVWATLLLAAYVAVSGAIVLRAPQVRDAAISRAGG